MQSELIRGELVANADGLHGGTWDFLEQIPQDDITFQDDDVLVSMIK